MVAVVDGLPYCNLHHPQLNKEISELEGLVESKVCLQWRSRSFRRSLVAEQIYREVCIRSLTCSSQMLILRPGRTRARARESEGETGPCEEVVEVQH